MNEEELKAVVRKLEKEIASHIGHRVEEVRKNGGDFVANELVMSVASLLAARSIGMICQWTSEPPSYVKQRFYIAMEKNLDETFKLIKKQQTMI